MIVKYLNEGVWGYIDNVRQIATRDIDTEHLIQAYNLEVENQERPDDASYMNGVKLADDIAMSNKAYLIASEECFKLNEIIGDYYQKNMLSPELVFKNLPAKVVLLYLNDHKEYDSIVLITNQTTYLMNDQGKTIERLV